MLLAETMESHVDLKKLRDHAERWNAWRTSLSPAERAALDEEQHAEMFRIGWAGGFKRPWTSARTGETKLMDSVHALHEALFAWQQARLARNDKNSPPGRSREGHGRSDE